MSHGVRQLVRVGCARPLLEPSTEPERREPVNERPGCRGGHGGIRVNPSLGYCGPHGGDERVVRAVRRAHEFGVTFFQQLRPEHDCEVLAVLEREANVSATHRREHRGSRRSTARRNRLADGVGEAVEALRGERGE